MGVELEKQVVSPDLARRLKELGVKQGGVFYWVDWAGGEPYLLFKAGTYFNTDPKKPSYAADYQFPNDLLFAAFTVAELGELLKGFKLPRWNPGKGWENTSKPYDWHTYADTEADARAKHLIHLIEQGVVKP